jgi:hypothetical protein
VPELAPRGSRGPPLRQPHAILRAMTPRILWRLAAPVALAAAGCAATAPHEPAADQSEAEPAATWPAFATDQPAPSGLSVERGSIGHSAGGVKIPVYTLWAPGDIEPDGRPAVLLVAGADARHRVGHEVARELIATLGEGAPEALLQTTLYIIPMLNPDAFEREGGGGPLDAAVPGGTLTPRDADRDGRIDEDGPVDLNGDGVVTMMRIENPEARQGGWGLTAAKVIDPDEPRLMRDPKPEEGERATHAVVIEGRDADGDGRIAEDGVGGVDLNRNFSYLWPELEPDAGVWPLSEPESLALVDWMLDRPNIYAVLVYGPGDTIVNIPAAGKFDPTGRVPTGIETDDKPTYERISKHFKEITGQTAAPTVDNNKGSLHGWAYAHFGALSFSTPVWVRPDLVKKEEPEGKSDEAAEEPERKDDTEPRGDESPPDEPPETLTLAGRTVTLTFEGVQAAMAEFAAASEDEQAKISEALFALPDEPRMRLMALMQGLPPRPAAVEGDALKGAEPKKKPAAESRSEDAEWLAHSDERDGAGFIDWAPFDHPDLGPVEIGGFRPGFKLNPPEEAIPGLVDEQAQFITKLLEMAPRLVIEDPRVEALGAGVWRISLRLRNDGQLATRSAIGVKARRLPPIVVHIDADDDALVSGSRIERTGAIGPHGAAVDHEWIVRAPAGSEGAITIRTAEWGDFEKTLTLEDGR